MKDEYIFFRYVYVSKTYLNRLGTKAHPRKTIYTPKEVRKKPSICCLKETNQSHHLQAFQSHPSANPSEALQSAGDDNIHFRLCRLLGFGDFFGFGKHAGRLWCSVFLGKLGRSVLFKDVNQKMGAPNFCSFTMYFGKRNM